MCGLQPRVPTHSIHVAWHNPEWAMPTCYVFRHGRDVARWSGWLGPDALRTEPSKAGVPY